VKPLLLSLVFVLSTAVDGFSQQVSFGRLSADVFDALSPSARVAGAPGAMTITRTACPNLPAATVRRRIVELAVQEWAFFGFTVVDQTEVSDDDLAPRRSRRPGDEQSARVATSIAGYWSVTPSGSWILDSQNKIWNGLDGTTARWRFPWSAAFVSWVMCEGGLAAPEQFQRAIAHHVYIDQAIRARDQNSTRSAFHAYDPGEAALLPGDLLCTSRRPSYRALEERRAQMGQGARSHCDIVVKVDRAAGRAFAIGGNVRGSVSLKIIPVADRRGILGPAAPNRGARVMFAHLKLAGAPLDPLDNEAFDASPTIRALGCAGASGAPARLAVSSLMPALRFGCSTSAAP
jgi:uncharacterized protein DUF2272